MSIQSALLRKELQDSARSPRGKIKKKAFLIIRIVATKSEAGKTGKRRFTSSSVGSNVKLECCGWRDEGVGRRILVPSKRKEKREEYRKKGLILMGISSVGIRVQKTI